MKPSKIDLLNSILITLFLLVTNVFAETTFFDTPDDAFILGGSTTGEVMVRTIGGITVGIGCKYKWNCTNWGECLPSGKQTINCTNIGTCSSAYKSPETVQNCIYIAPIVEKEDKGLGNETVKQNETVKISEKAIVDNNGIFLYFIILIIGFIIFYLKKDYFRKLIKKLK